MILACAAVAQPVLSEESTSAAAVRDAQVLVEHMRNFETEGLVSLTYMPPAVSQGLTVPRMRQAVEQLNTNLRSMGAEYLHFELGNPTETFDRPEGLFILIPYSCTLQANGQTVQQNAFFIGHSGDSGATWKFMDGIATARVPISTILPGYNGPELPLVERFPVR
jgi:hypothetical protein